MRNVQTVCKLWREHGKLPNLQITGTENSSNKTTGEDVPTLKNEMFVLVQSTNGQDQKRNSLTSVKTLKTQEEERTEHAVGETARSSHMTLVHQGNTWAPEGQVPKKILSA